LSHGAPEQAERLVADDQFLREGLLERHWISEWIADSGSHAQPKAVEEHMEPIKLSEARAVHHWMAISAIAVGDRGTPSTTSDTSSRR
jgi:hypothetical protein